MRSLFAVGLALLYPLLVLWQLHRTRTGGSGALRDRAEVLVAVGAGALFLLFSRAITDWEAVPPAVWLIGLLLVAATVLLAGMSWSRLPWLRPQLKPSRRRLRATSAVVQLVLLGAAVAVLL